jgi:hypothetical protein
MYWDGNLKRQGLVGLDIYNKADVSHEAFAGTASQFQPCGENTFKNMYLYYYDGYKWWPIKWNNDVPTVEPVNATPMKQKLEIINGFYWLTTWIE